MNATTPEIVLRGILRPDGTVELTEKPALAAGPVEVILRPIKPSLIETFEQINREQQARGFKGRSGAEIDADLREARGDEEHEERMRQIHANTIHPLPDE
jgi:hypothetical protein